MVDQLDPSEERDLGMAGWLGFQMYRIALAEGLRGQGYSDLRDADWSLLRYLHHSGGATVTEIARLFGVTKQAASQHVASFVERGYGVRTRSDGDARVRVVVLTDKGRAARRAAVEVAREVEAELVERLGPEALLGWRRVNDALLDMHLHQAPEMVRVATEMSSAD
ncbi:MAG: MarR family winged helix-turn-helix transcriptional regulator [Acidimicrobiia bacterium]